MTAPSPIRCIGYAILLAAGASMAGIAGFAQVVGCGGGGGSGPPSTDPVAFMIPPVGDIRPVDDYNDFLKDEQAQIIILRETIEARTARIARAARSVEIVFVRSVDLTSVGFEDFSIEDSRFPGMAFPAQNYLEGNGPTFRRGFLAADGEGPCVPSATAPVLRCDTAVLTLQPGVLDPGTEITFVVDGSGIAGYLQDEDGNPTPDSEFFGTTGRVAFMVGDETGPPLELDSYTLRLADQGGELEGLLEVGDCVTCTSTFTLNKVAAKRLYFPPHGRLRGQFNQVPARFGFFVELNNAMIGDIFSLFASGIRLEFRTLPGDRGEFEFSQVVGSTAVPWTPGQVIESLSIVSDDMAVQLGTPTRFILEPTTQTETGAQFTHTIADTTEEVPITIATTFEISHGRYDGIEVGLDSPETTRFVSVGDPLVSVPGFPIGTTATLSVSYTSFVDFVVVSIRAAGDPTDPEIELFTVDLPVCDDALCAAPGIPIAGFDPIAFGEGDRRLFVRSFTSVGAYVGGDHIDMFVDVDNDFDGVENALDVCPGADDNLDSDDDGTANGCDDCTDADGDGLGAAGWDTSGCLDLTEDADDGNPFVCADTDGDTCDDCSVANEFMPGTDGADVDGDGICDDGDGFTPPVLAPIGDQTVTLGQTLVLDLDATDADGDLLTFSATPFPLPPGAGLDSAAGMFIFGPVSEQRDTTVTITFRVSDGALFDEETIDIVVADAPLGTPTSLRGRIVDANDAALPSPVDTPIEGVTVSLLGTSFSTTSDANGEFVLTGPTGIPSGENILDLDTSVGAPTYAGFREAIDIIEGVENVVGRSFFLPRLETPVITVLPDGTKRYLNTRLQVYIDVPPGVAKLEDDSDYTGDLSISEVPGGLAPAPLPDFLEPGLLVTIQPVGVRFTEPVSISFPNFNDLAPGSLVDIWSLDPELGEFADVGDAQVSGDGVRIDTISGGVRAADWHAQVPPGVDANAQCADGCVSCSIDSGSSTSVVTGNLSIDHTLPSYVSQGRSRAVRLVYNSLRGDPRPVIDGSGTIFEVAAVPDLLSATLEVGGIRLGAEVFTSTVGISESEDTKLHQAMQFDGSGFPTGIYSFELSLSSNYGRVVPIVDGDPDADVRPTVISSSSGGRVSIANERNSVFGAGWTMDGFDRLYRGADGSLLLVEGGTEALLDFTPGVRPTETIEVLVPGWRLSKSIPFADARSALLNPMDGLIYVARRPPSTGGAVYRLEADGSEMLLTGADQPAALAVNAANGDVFLSEDKDGDVFRIEFGTTGRTQWIKEFIFGADDDPVGMAIAPPTYSGTVVSVGEGIVVDRGFFTCSASAGCDNIWRFPSDVQFGQTLLHGDNGTLVDALDVAIGASEVYVVDSGAGADGAIYNVDASGALTQLVTDVPLPGPTGVVEDPQTGELLVSGDQRIVRVDVATGQTTEIMRGFVSGLSVASIDISQDGETLLVTENDAVHVFSRQEAFFALGDFSEIVVNDDGTLTRMFPNGTKTHFDATGRQTSVVDRHSNTTLYAYNAGGQLETITDPVGRPTTFAYGPDGRLDSITDPAFRTTTFMHDAAGDLVKIINPDTTERSFTYDGRHRLDSQISERMFTTTYAYDALTGRHRLSRLPDGSRRVIESVSSVGIYAPDPDDPTSIGTPEQPALPQLEETVAGSFSDGEDRLTSYAAGPLGLIVGRTDAAGHSTTAVRNVEGLVEQVSLPSGHDETFGYDAVGKVASHADETLGGSESWSYDGPFSQLGTYTDPSMKDTTFLYDTDDNLDTVDSPLSRTTSFEFALDGQLTDLAAPDGTRAAFVYDPVDRHLREIREGMPPNERVTLLTRTPEGYVDTLTRVFASKPDQVTDFDYDDFGRVTRVLRPDTSEVGYGYDAAGNLDSVTPPGRPAHTLAYTLTNRLEQYTPPSLPGVTSPETTFEYNDAQQIDRVVRPGGLVIDPEYDMFGRLDFVTIPEGTIDVSYDPGTGRIDMMQDADGGRLLFGYQSERVNRFEWDAAPVTGAVSATYDASGRVDTLTVEQSVTGFAHTVNYGYDDDGLLIRVGDSSGDLDIIRNPTTGQVELMTLGGLSEDWTFNEFGEPASYAVSFGASLLYMVSYDEYDEVGRLVQKTEEVDGGAPVVFVYDYDSVGRLDTVFRDGIPVEGYDFAVPDGLNDNRTAAIGVSGSIAYDEQDRLLTYDEATYDYTPHGELLVRSDALADTSFEYDVLGNRRRTASTAVPPITYQIDAQNRRIGKVVDTMFVRGWLYKDGVNPVAELDSSGAIRDVFVYASRPHVPDYVVRGTEKYRYVVDRVGSVRLVVSVSDGSVVARRDYDSFGNILFEVDGGEFFATFGFAGGAHDADTGLVRFGVRDYDPRIGRWTAKDPSRFGDGVNLYAYAANDPVNFHDITGRGIKSTDTPAAVALFAEIGLFGGGSASFGTTAVTVGGIGALGGGLVAAADHCLDGDDFVLPDSSVAMAVALIRAWGEVFRADEDALRRGPPFQSCWEGFLECVAFSSGRRFPHSVPDEEKFFIRQDCLPQLLRCLGGR